MPQPTQTTGVLEMEIPMGQKLHCPHCGARLSVRLRGESNLCEKCQHCGEEVCYKFTRKGQNKAPAGG